MKQFKTSYHKFRISNLYCRCIQSTRFKCLCRKSWLKNINQQKKTIKNTWFFFFRICSRSNNIWCFTWQCLPIMGAWVRQQREKELLDVRQCTIGIYNDRNGRCYEMLIHMFLYRGFILLQTRRRGNGRKDCSFQERWINLYFNFLKIWSHLTVTRW